MRAYLINLGLTTRDPRSVNKASTHALVYDMRNYCFEASFGPYLPDSSGRVNWMHCTQLTHLHAIHRTLATHLVDLHESELFIYPLIPMSIPYCQSIIPPGLNLEKVYDWAGIEGL